MPSEFHSQTKFESDTRPPSKPSQLQTPVFTMKDVDDDDDFQTPFTLPPSTHKSVTSLRKHLNPSNSAQRQHKKPKRYDNADVVGKENVPVQKLSSARNSTFSEVETSATNESVQSQSSNPSYALDDSRDDKFDEKVSLERIQHSIDCTHCEVSGSDSIEDTITRDKICSFAFDEKKGLKKNGAYLLNSIESKLIVSRKDCDLDDGHGNFSNGKKTQQFDELEILLNLCSQIEEEDRNGNMALHHLQRVPCGTDSTGCLVHCPLCGVDISDLRAEDRQVHTNGCLDNEASPAQEVTPPVVEMGLQASEKALDVSPVVEWLRNLGLGRYEDVFVREEIDWDTLQWLKEEDLINIGISTLGPRKKIVHALEDLRQGSLSCTRATTEHGKRRIHSSELRSDSAEDKVYENSKQPGNKLITDYFPGPMNERKKVSATTGMQHTAKKTSSSRMYSARNQVRNRQFQDIPPWCCIPGTPFRVDAFKFLRGDCSYWFLTHFHMDHYQGLTRNFSCGKIYCSLITAKLVNLKMGIPWDKLQVLPLNQNINIAGVDVTCLDANHCPGSIIILFQPANGKAVLHTGDFRYSDEMASQLVLQTCSIHTLILDTTYCNPQFNFPKQEAVIQFVIDAIQAEAFNPNTLFLIGSYTIGKERLFLEVARVLRKKVYVTAAKLNLLKCLGYVEDDMKWFTLNERESNIHVVPLWTLASFKRLKHVCNQYVDRFSLIVAFSPTGWTFGKGKKKSPGRRWQQGTIIRYEVPYSEHCSFTELQEFLKLVSPVNIIPSVNNNGPESVQAMISLLLS